MQSDARRIQASLSGCALASAAACMRVRGQQTPRASSLLATYIMLKNTCNTEPSTLKSGNA